MKTSFPLLILLLVLFLAACSKKETSEIDEPSDASEALHLSFKTPDWERHIDCSHLDLFPETGQVGVFSVSASSASTLESFRFYYPSDSSALVATGNLKKYPIQDFAVGGGLAFTFAQKLPLDANSFDTSRGRLISNAGLSETEYNEVLGVKYLSSDANYAHFRIKCKYSMKARLVGGTGNNIEKAVSGTFTFKVRALKK